MKLKILSFLMFLFSCFLTKDLLPQDQHFIESVLSGHKSYFEEFSGGIAEKFTVESPFYEFDLNSDKNMESFVFEKKADEDWISIYDVLKKTKFFSYKFETKGKGSKCYKISIRRISKDTVVYLLFFYEGFIQYLDFYGSSRLYLMTIDKNDIKTLAVYKGPIIWQETSRYRGLYSQKDYLVDLFDYNGDGTKEVFVKNHRMSTVIFYDGSGKWHTI